MLSAKVLAQTVSSNVSSLMISWRDSELVQCRDERRILQTNRQVVPRT